MRRILLVISVLGFMGCASIKPYEKEYLLHPLMDDAAVNSMRPELMPAAASKFERLSSAAPGAGGATSCPTCGG